MRLDVVGLNSPLSQAELSALSSLTIATVADGGSIGFLDPLDPADAEAFWRDAVAPNVASGATLLFAARDSDRIVGTVQLVVALPPNQPHRAEIAKMMVHPNYRRRGLGRRLVNAALDAARGLGKRLATLDTRTGDPSQALYAACGFIEAGVIPDYALDPDGRGSHGTTLMYRRLP